MKKTIVATESAPAAVGPYSQAVAGGGLLFCSGQIPLDPQTGELVGGSIGDQTRRCMQNLEAVLEAGGTSIEGIVKTTVFLTNIDDYAEFNEAYATFVGAEPPARAAFAVSALPKGASVEIECIAQL
ncbi:MAG: 2-iminobutanoate/2-iminopropanoate deaminase [Actinomycetota bacterium]|jgi:2-iminobutanoate/2-iminopropanoate deaminase|nr:2-iminobutanoate/2-iminopropanoate deaminase [Actinomycetota bacterium]